MFIRSFSDTARRIAKRFRSDDHGNVAMIFAITMVPLFGFIGAAIDYSRANAARSSMQVALDSAALMVSKDLGANPKMSASDVSAKAVSYFNALYTNPSTGSIAVTASYTTNTQNGSTVTVSGTGAITTDFMKIVGLPQMNIASASTTTWGSTRMRVAMALDNTGSMASSGKMTALKTAAKSLIDQLEAATRTNGDVYISIVPFAKDVNISSVASTSTTWLRWDLGQCTKQNGGYGSTALGFVTQTECTAMNGRWTATTQNGWTGCVSDRYDTTTNTLAAYDTLSTAPYNITATDPIMTARNTQFPAENYSDCPTSLMPLTYDWTALKNKVDAMQPTGNTNQAIGMAWAWLSLLQQNPLNAPAEDSDYKYTKAIILLSDGDNTQNRVSSTTSAIDARQKLLCDNAKTSGIVIYTIQVNTNNDNNSSVMSYCASNSGNYFSTTTASGIATAFAAIGNSLNQLRVAR